MFFFMFYEQYCHAISGKSISKSILECIMKKIVFDVSPDVDQIANSGDERVQLGTEITPPPPGEPQLELLSYISGT